MITISQPFRCGFGEIFDVDFGLGATWNCYGHLGALRMLKIQLKLQRSMAATLLAFSPLPQIFWPVLVVRATANSNENDEDYDIPYRFQKLR